MITPFKTLILFGATGDLAQRMLFPSLYNLDCDGLLGADVRIIGVARGADTDEAFQAKVDESLKRFLVAELYDAAKAATFVARIGYCAVDTAADDGFKALSDRVCARAEQGLAYYMSTPPALFAPIAAGLAKAGLAGPLSRIAMEKPIGQDLTSSRTVNEAIGAVFDEERVFRVDHYLGKETVQNLLVMRFGNTLFEPLWNANAIEHIQITVGETVGLEGRVSYYDGVGALKDMVQNHMLQLLALVAMEPPAGYTATAVRDEKVKVLRALRPMSSTDVATHSVKGQYASGAIDGQPVKGYAEELGAASNTETFVALKAHIDNWRWKGVPFYLRTGKRLMAKESEIVIRYKPVPHSIFGNRAGGLQPNTLIMKLQPQEGIRMTVMAKEPGLDRGGIELKQVDLDVSLTAAFAGTRRRIAYERLLLDLLEGDTTLFVRRDEIEAAWTWIDSIHDAWETTDAQCKPYTAGTWGPSAAIALIERDGASWHE
jgi:glucose-6-phosphate 1-dehydrogenase